MTLLDGTRGGALACVAVMLVLLPTAEAGAQQTARAAGVPAHRHDPIDVDARPIIGRVPVLLVQPRRLLFSRDGDLFVADWGGGTVLKIARDEEVTVVAEGLDEPAGLALDSAGNLYVSTHAAGMTDAGTIVRISPAGEQSVIAAGLTGPTALALDGMENLYVASFHEDTISMVGMDGSIALVAENIPSPAGLAFDDSGTLFAVSSTEGAVFSISPVGEVSMVARGLMVPSDLAFDPDGHLIVAGYAGNELTYVDGKGGMRTFALVPKGTIALEFDRDGNVLLANWDEPLLLKVTTELSIPCPHCEKRIPLRLRPKKKRHPPAKRSQPMI